MRGGLMLPILSLGMCGNRSLGRLNLLAMAIFSLDKHELSKRNGLLVHENHGGSAEKSSDCPSSPCKVKVRYGVATLVLTYAR